MHCRRLRRKRDAARVEGPAGSENQIAPSASAYSWALRNSASDERQSAAWLALRIRCRSAAAIACARAWSSPRRLTAADEPPTRARDVRLGHRRAVEFGQRACPTRPPVCGVHRHAVEQTSRRWREGMKFRADSHGHALRRPPAQLRSQLAARRQRRRVVVVRRRRRRAALAEPFVQRVDALAENVAVRRCRWRRRACGGSPPASDARQDLLRLVD